jgi:hypothetical protein
MAYAAQKFSSRSSVRVEPGHRAVLDEEEGPDEVAWWAANPNTACEVRARVRIVMRALEPV